MTLTPPSGRASLQTTDADNNLLQDSLLRHKKENKIMKKIILSLTVLMSIVGTGTSFGSTKQNVKNSPKQEIVCNQKNSTKCECKTCKDLENKQQKVDTKKHKTTCQCSNCKKQTKKQVVKQPVKQTTTLHQTTKK